MNDHQEFDYVPEEHVKHINLDNSVNKKGVLENIINPPPLFDYYPESTISSETESLFSETLHPDSLALDLDGFHAEFFCSSPEGSSEERTMVAWNNTPSCMALQRHVFLHKYKQGNVSFNVEGLLSGSRGAHKSKGALERASEELLRAAMEGDVQRVLELLASAQVDVDVADRSGHTALLGAAVSTLVTPQ